MGDVDDELGPFRMFRPYRDVRFSKDKSPYKTAAAAYSEREGGGGLYLQLSANGLFVGSGHYHMASDQLARFRDALDDDEAGAEIVAICARAGEEAARDRCHGGAQDRAAGLSQGPPPHRPPATQGPGRRAVLPAGWTGCTPPRPSRQVVEAWREQAPMNDWLDAHVGPSELPPDDREW